ncbi:MAG: hypothetical protein KC933_32035 [Myxococcales bacterium]|nr:hypothetical protein [Myxococcales bacterium]MCB9647544.1 hypothetical protein [Deltaproteobacteria bacterium]
MVDRKKYDGASLEVLEGLEPIRIRPAMYVGPLDAPDLPVRLLRQALCHAVDCALDGACTHLRISASGRTAQVSYDAGIPLELHPRHGHPVALLFLTLHAGCRNLKKHIEVGDELCDLGLAVLTALSADLRVRTVHSGKTATYHFSRGKEVAEAKITACDEADSTAMSIALDPDILGDNVVFEPGLVRAAAELVQARLPALAVQVECA